VLLITIDGGRYSVMTMSTPPTSGERLKQLREKRRWSLREAGRQTGLSHSTIQQLEARVGRWDGVKRATLQKLARGYGVNIRVIDQIAEGAEPYTAPDETQVEHMLESLRVHPDWLIFPVYGSASAGDGVPEPLTGEVAYIPREHLSRRGSKPESIRVYIVNGSCMVSDEARRLEKNFAPGDYVAVDVDRPYAVGDTVVAWWPDMNAMIIKRYKVEGENIVLFPLAPGHPQVVLPSEDAVHIIGPVVWRGG